MESGIVAIDSERYKEIEQWNKEGKPSSFIDPQGLSQFPKFVRAKEFIKSHSEIKRILDVGCFTGYFIRHLAREGYRCVGIDIQKDLMKIMNDMCKGNPRFMYLNAQNSSLLEEKFDCICLFDILEHCLDDRLVITEAESIINHGFVIINLPRNQEYTDESQEHIRIYTDGYIEELFGSKKNYSFEILKDEHGRNTSFITYEV